jgi:hypothetical protein
MLIAQLGTRKAGAFSAQPTLSDSLGLTWTEIDDQNGPNTVGRMRMRLLYTMIDQNPQSMTVSAACADSDALGLALVGVGGVAATFSNKVTATNAAGDPSITLSGTPVAVLGFALAQADNGFTPPTGYTEAYDLSLAVTQMRMTAVYDISEPGNPLAWVSSNTNSVATAWELTRAASSP